jgi:hypothetical protein
VAINNPPQQAAPESEGGGEPIRCISDLQSKVRIGNLQHHSHRRAWHDWFLQTDAIEACWADNDSNLTAQLELRIERNRALHGEYAAKATAMESILQFAEAP